MLEGSKDVVMFVLALDCELSKMIKLAISLTRLFHVCCSMEPHQIVQTPVSLSGELSLLVVYNV